MQAPRESGSNLFVVVEEVVLAKQGVTQFLKVQEAFPISGREGGEVVYGGVPHTAYF